MWCKVISAFGAVGDAQMVSAPALMKDATRCILQLVLSPTGQLFKRLVY